MAASDNRTNQSICLPYGKKEITISLPDKNTYVINPPDYPGIADVEKLVKQALKNPIGSPTLSELVRDKQAGSVCIIVNDITRPTPTEAMLSAIAEELNSSGIQDSNINILVATGTHRPNTPEELHDMIGPEALKRFRVTNHDCLDEQTLVQVGETRRGMAVVVNRIFAGADLRIATGIITPHQGAGFSGGRKSVMPGIAGLASLRRHHGVEFRAKTPVMGKLEDNPFHEEALESARIAGLDYIVNSVPNYKKETVAVVAGDLEKAWLEGVTYARKVSEVSIPCQSDITIVHCGGHPRDFNLYQAQKSIASAELITKPGGIIIVLGECSDGIGSEVVQKWLEDAQEPGEVMDRFNKEGFSPGTSKARAFGRALSNFRIYLVSEAICSQTLQRMFMNCFPDLDSALAEASKHSSADRIIIMLRNAAGIIPVLAAE